MNKPLSISKINRIKTGDQITVSNHPAATWFTIVSIGKFTAEIKEKDLYRSQFIDKFIICTVR